MKIGFIGAGNMAGAIIKGIVAQKFANVSDIFCYDALEEKLAAFVAETNVNASASNEALVKASDIVVLAVKPNVLDVLLPQLRSRLSDQKPLLVSIAAGTNLEKLQALTSPDLAIVRVMPNVNATIGAGVAAVCGNNNVTKEQVQLVLELFRAVGTAMELPEKDFSTFTAIAGSSPAYAFLFIDALSRGAVKNGLPKDIATRIAAQAVLGSAKMILESGESPWNLIDKVCSPGGTTIAGLMALEEGSFLSTVVKSVDATIQKDLDLMKK